LSKSEEKKNVSAGKSSRLSVTSARRMRHTEKKKIQGIIFLFTSSEGPLGDVGKHGADPFFFIVEISDSLVGHLAVEVRILQRITCIVVVNVIVVVEKL